MPRIFRRYAWPILMLLAFLSGSPARAQEAEASAPVPVRLDKLPLMLNQHWRYQPGDNPAWADPRLNDSGWTSGISIFSTDPKERNSLPFPGVGWFRIRISADSSVVGKALAVTPMHDGAIDVFIDGLRVQPSEKGEDDMLSRQPGIRATPPMVFTLSEPGVHLLAVRFADSALAAGKSTRGGFTIVINTLPAAMEAFGSQATIVTSALVLFFTFFFSFGLIHLILFLFYRAERSNAFFSVFCLSLGALFLASYVVMCLGNKQMNALMNDYGFVLIAAAFASLSAFINQLFGRGRLRYRIAQALIIATIAGCFVGVVADYVLPVLMALACLEAVVLLLRAIFRKVPGSSIIGTGILFFILVMIGMAFLVFAGPAVAFTMRSDAGSALTFCVILAIISIPLSMSVYLAWNYARINRNLGNQLATVERLSSEAREHEAEKQRLLEVRAEDLEREVSIRTEELRRQRDKSDELLQNILPAEVAEELKEKGSAAARLYDNVTVLFTDFADFTQRSESLTPDALVAELNHCFSAFDGIITRHGLEKIKTVGDAYIAVSGLPAANERHAQAVIAAALEVRDFMEGRRAEHPQSFSIRLGVHSGPVVAGIVGVKKFAYDIWGDTVNTAARMEQHSEPGRLNISAATYSLVKDDFSCTFRGELEAKHKGKMGMYFVEPQPAEVSVILNS